MAIAALAAAVWSLSRRIDRYDHVEPPVWEQPTNTEDR